MNWNLAFLKFEEKGKLEYDSEKKTAWSKDKNQEQTQHTTHIICHTLILCLLPPVRTCKRKFPDRPVMFSQLKTIKYLTIASD